MITESVDHEDQHSPQQDHDVDDSGSRSHEHLRLCIHILFNYILYTCQGINNNGLLPNLIQPTSVPLIPGNINRLESFPPQLQVQSLHGNSVYLFLVSSMDEIFCFESSIQYFAGYLGTTNTF